MIITRQLIFKTAAAAVCILMMPHSIHAQDSDIPGIIRIASRVKQVVTGGEKSFGIDAGTVISSDYDTGFGTGVRFNQTFEHPYIDRPFIESSPTLQFWGASNKTEDLSVIGIIECLTHRMPTKHKFTGFAGLTFGYYYIYRTIGENTPDGTEKIEKNTNSFEVFITLGGEYELMKKSSVFLQLKYGETVLSREVHALLGLNFRYWKEENG